MSDPLSRRGFLKGIGAIAAAVALVGPAELLAKLGPTSSPVPAALPPVLPSRTRQLADRVLSTIGRAKPKTVYLALYTSDPTNGEGTEVSGGGYARQSVHFEADAAGALKNQATVTFPQASSDWGTVDGVTVFDAGERPLIHFALSRPRTILSGDMALFARGDIGLMLQDQDAASLQ